MPCQSGGMNEAPEIWLAGIDGCRAGWLAVFLRPADDAVRMTVLPRFAGVADAPEKPAVIAVDIPIGLPERTGLGGRAAENAVRSLLGARQSSVFSVPSRAALARADYREACATALRTSDPPRAISKQLFMIAPKIREVDSALRANAALAARTFEVHPEVAFWRMNAECALTEPKKVKGKVYPPGLALRRRLLIDAGLSPSLVESAPPRGAAEDDLLDALACLVTAKRIHAGIAQPFPDPPPRDALGLRMAIWA
ncbi:MAG: DUF429 domain-containing protein [Pseudorhodoplanes sp.]